jgi:hypothetical protein
MEMHSRCIYVAPPGLPLLEVNEIRGLTPPAKLCGPSGAVEPNDASTCIIPAEGRESEVDT